jgi:DNA repair exonuclease SbcCD nuclease subunit
VTNNHFADWIYDCKHNDIEVIILVGNHDISSLGDERVTLLHPLQYFDNVKLINEPYSGVFPNGTISFVPFRRNQDVVREMINNVTEQAKRHNANCVDQQVNFLFYHGAVLGAKISNREFLDENEALAVEDLHPEFFDQVFLGHFHKHQKVSDNVRYVGSPLHHDLNDAGDQKGFYHYDLTENKLKFVKTKYPSFVKVEIESSEDWNREFNDFDYYVINVNEEVSVPDKFNSMSNVKIHKFNKRVKQQRMDIEYKATEKLDSNKLVEAYVNHLNNEKLDKDRLIRMGRELLNG